MREEWVVGMAIESELQHLRAGYLKLVSKVETSGVIDPRSSAMNRRAPSSRSLVALEGPVGKGTEMVSLEEKLQ